MTIIFKRGSIQIQKAGEKVAQKVGQKVPLGTPRAVTKEEAPFILPARESTKVTMMPWKGWVQRMLQDTVGEEKLQQLRKAFLFDKDDPFDLLQVPYADHKVSVSKTDPSQKVAYRYPSPGSQPAVRVPKLLDGEDPYDSGYFKRDTRRRWQFDELDNPNTEKLKLSIMDQDDPDVQDELKRVEEGPKSSPGNKGRFATGPTDFDPSGLRATMSVTWAETEKSLDLHMPDHLPKPTWMGKEDEIKQWYDERDLPLPMGAPYEGLVVPRKRRVFMW